MDRRSILQLSPATVPSMSPADRERLVHLCRNLRGLIYGYTTTEEHKAFEHAYGMTVLQAKDHTLALLDACQEANTLA